MAETADVDDLKRSYDELVESSREIEDALTDELEVSAAFVLGAHPCTSLNPTPIAPH